MAQGLCHVGTSGWSYLSWRGRFYPPTLPQHQWLGYYAKHFDTVEVNSSFYRVPTAPMVRRWRELPRKDFFLAMRLWRGITHLKKLRGTAEHTKHFMKIANGLAEKRGPLLVQLPSSLGKDMPRLEEFLDELYGAMEGVEWRVALEIRHPSWLQGPELVQTLNRRGMALCIADFPACPVKNANEVGWVFVRRHGPGGEYAGNYSMDMIENDGRQVKRWIDEGRDVFVYFNNDIDGYAVQNAQELIAAAGVTTTS